MGRGRGWGEPWQYRNFFETLRFPSQRVYPRESEEGMTLVFISF